MFADAFEEERSLTLWQWRYGDLPGGTDYILLARDEQGELCGHYACIPLTIVYRGGELPGALLLDLMVRSDRQRMGIGVLLIETIRRHIKGRLALAISFPNTKSTGPTIKKGPHYLGEAPLYWRLEDISSLLKGLGRPRPPSLFNACANTAIHAFYRLLALPESLQKKYGHERKQGFGEDEAPRAAYGRDGCGIYVKRDETFLAWRFDRHPEMDYTVLFLTRGGSSEAAGYAVLAVMEYQGFRIGFIVDLLVQPPALRPARYILSQAARWLETQGVEAISCMMTGKNAYTRALESLGFVRVPNRFMPRDLNFSIRVHDPDIDYDYATDPGNWILTWADTDLV